MHNNIGSKGRIYTTLLLRLGGITEFNSYWKIGFNWAVPSMEGSSEGNNSLQGPQSQANGTIQD
jgi:hypothetical protein